MAEIQNKVSDNKKGGRRGKKLSTRIDLTPMVDLGFLLITFFVFTTSLNKPTALNFVLPKDTKDPPFTAAGKTISILLDGNNTIYYYNGDSVNNMHVIKSANGLRSILQQKKVWVKQHYKDKGGVVVLIKPTKEALYTDIINAFDEMLINDIRSYFLMDTNSAESATLRKL
jgi:biopolymer transport protein ExbD